MKPVVELLQKELGETVPPMTNNFFCLVVLLLSTPENLGNRTQT